MKCFVSLSLVVCFCLLSSISVAQTTLPTEPLFEGAKKYGTHERFMDAVNEKRCMKYMKQWEVVTDYDGNPLPASDPYTKQLIEERKKYGVSARDLQNENLWYMKFMNVEATYISPVLVLIREDGQIRHRDISREQISDPEPNCSMKGTFYFYTPHEVRNMAAIMYTYYDPARESDYWIYLPSLRRFRRISAADRDDSFFGSDCTWADAADIKVDEERHRILREEPYPTHWKDVYTVAHPEIWEHRYTHGGKGDTFYDGTRNTDIRAMPSEVFDATLEVYPQIKKKYGPFLGGRVFVPKSKGCPTYVIESIPQWPTYYAKKITWIKKAPRFSINQEYYDPKGRFVKYFMRTYITFGNSPKPPYDSGWGISWWYLKDLSTNHCTFHDANLFVAQLGWHKELYRFTQPYVSGRGK